MITIKETAGDTLEGAIDGANTDFETSFDIADPVSVFLNGILLQADLETGYWVIPPRIIRMKEAPQAGPDDADTLEVEYRANVKAGGGALGGCPPAPVVGTFTGAELVAQDNKPSVGASGLEPTADARENTPTTFGTAALRPAMVGNNNNEGGC